MAANTELTTLQYNLEWEDHLDALYGSFIRRNNKEEWVYFLRRPEFSDSETSEKIAEVILGYITSQRNISREIIDIIESVFKYSENREKYEDILGFEALELYTQRQLKEKEFPPYDLLGELDDENNYDGYLELFTRTYFEGNTIEPEEFVRRFEWLETTGVTHPYEPLLKSDYFISCNEIHKAAAVLKDMEDGYHKYMACGHICMLLNDYSGAETWLSEAIKVRNNNLDGQLIGDLILSKWYNNKPDEALAYIEGFIEAGYEHIVLPLKEMVLSEITKVLLEKGKEVELTETELLLVKDCYKIFGDHESVIHLAEISWQRNFSDESWTVDSVEAYFETGAYENAEKIIEMVYDGRKQLSLKGQLKIRELKARILFKVGRINDALEIMKNICGQENCELNQKYILAQMYMATGNYKSAYKILSALRYYQGNNIKFIFDIGVCFEEAGKTKKAAQMFRNVCQNEPNYKKAAMHYIQCIIDDDHELSHKNAKLLFERYQDLFSDEEKAYLQGQIFEMEDKCKEAKALYKSIIDKYDSGDVSDTLMNNALLRYHIMDEELGGRIGEMEQSMIQYLDKYPKADLLWIYRAEFYESTDYNTELIKECYEKALAANRFNSEARMMLAGIYIDEELSDKALELYNEEILLTDSEDAYLMRAYQMVERGNYEQAKADIAAYESRGGDKNEVIELNATIFMHCGEYEKALFAIEELNKINKGKKPQAYDDLAVCLCKLGREAEAVKLLDVVCESYKQPLLHTILYNIQVHNGDFKDAKKTLKRYRKLCGFSRTDEWLTLLSALADLDSGKGQKAYMVSMSMIEPEGERFNGILELFYGKAKASVKLLRSALKNEPDNLDNYSWLSFVYFLEGNHNETLTVANDGLEKFYDTYGTDLTLLDCEALCQYGFLKMMCGEMEEAYSTLKKAAEQTTCPEFICRKCYEAHAGLGIYHAIKGEYIQANKEFGESLQERPNNAICKMIQDRMCRM